MTSALSNLADNFAERTHKIKCKYQHDNEKRKTFGISYKDWECCLDYSHVKNDLIDTNIRVELRNTKKKKPSTQILKRNFLIHGIILTMISINLFCSC